MSFHLSHIHEYSRFLAIDIGTYRVRTGVYSTDNFELSELGYSSVRQNRKNFSFGLIANMRGVAETIEQSILQATQKLDVIPEDVVISFSSSDFFFDSVTTQYVRLDPTSTLTMQELDTMIKRIEANSYSRTKEKIKKNAWIIVDDLRLISSTITNISIDGKKITNPVWSSGWKVLLTVLNVFAPASEFNVLRSIVASLWRKAISIIPTPLLFPKIVEQTSFVNEPACYVDIGYSHTTILITENNEIKTFETFNVWARMLMEMIKESYKSASLLGIENILCSEQNISDERYVSILEDFFTYVWDMIMAFLEEEGLKIRLNHLFLHGNIFENKFIAEKFSQHFDNLYGYHIEKHHLKTLIPKENAHQEVITYALALTATELLLVKKDPLIRILRYVLYNYE